MSKLWKDAEGNIVARVYIHDILEKLINLKTSSIWESCDKPIRKKEVLAVPESEFIDARYNTVGMDYEERITAYPREWHVRRIAYLVKHGWSDPIEIEIGGFSSWPIYDGNHRLVAAVFRGDTQIDAIISGLMFEANEIFGWYSEKYYRKILKKLGCS